MILKDETKLKENEQVTNVVSDQKDEEVPYVTVREQQDGYEAKSTLLVVSMKCETWLAVN